MSTATSLVDPGAVEHAGLRLPATFVWGHGSGRLDRVRLYEASKANRWDAAADLDWSMDVDPRALPADWSLRMDWSAFGGPLVEALGDDPDVLAEVVAQHHGWLVSQILHGEQGALIGAAEVCAAAESPDDKLTTAVLVAEEARHVEAYQRYLDKIGISYPISRPLHDLLSQVVNHDYADMTYLGTQLLVEGIAGAASSLGGALFANPLIQQITALVRADEARHVAYGLLSLQCLYDEMSASELREREDFVIESCRLLSDQFQPIQVWEHFGIDTDVAAARFADSCDVLVFRSLVFSQVVPNLHALGLLTSRVRDAFEAMGVLPLDCHIDLASASAPVDVSTSLYPPTVLPESHDDPFLALRAVLGTIEQIDPEPVLCVLAGLANAGSLAEIPSGRIRLQIAGFDEGDWLLTVRDTELSYRRAGADDEADVQVRMDANMWTEFVAGRISVPAALTDERVAIVGDRTKATVLEAIF